jgi:glutamine synthetase
MNERITAVRSINQASVKITSSEKAKHLKSFGHNIFRKTQIKQLFPKKIAVNWLAAMDGVEPIDWNHLDLIAEVLKEWAISRGATHYCHWFQPLTGQPCEKHHSFLGWKGEIGHTIDQFSKKQLFRGEADASSLPSGGLCKTAAGRGYTIWDPTTPVFLWEDGDGITLCLPSLFISWSGAALDTKIPLHRSEQKLSQAVLRLLKLSGIDAQKVFSTLGPEQEYFLIDRNFFNLRPDLVLSGRTVFGARPPKGQQMEDHYYASIDSRVLAFMRDFEQSARLLSIPITTHHNEVAPAQYETAPLYEQASVASDHNVMLMEIMRKTAEQHNLACLFHEKPFAGINGSGKHCNWSIATDTGLNLLEVKENYFPFLVLLTAILRAVHQHAPLMRASIGSAHNDWRIGGFEAPPSIISIYLGQQLDDVVQEIIHDRKKPHEQQRMIELNLANILPIRTDNSDRNRTSFFAFNHNRFEFRAVGSSQNVAWPMSVINTIVADSLQLILDEIEDIMSHHPKEDLLIGALPILRKHLKESEGILFSGDNYTLEWQQEAQRRSLPHFSKSFHSYAVLRDPKTQRVFQGVLSADELTARQEILYEQYAKELDIECRLMIELFRTQILPAALQTQQKWAKSVIQITELKISDDGQRKHLELFSEQINQAIGAIDELELNLKQAQGLGWEALAKVFCELMLPRMDKARHAVDLLENLVDDSLWPLPKYREMLFLQ